MDCLLKMGGSEAFVSTESISTSKNPESNPVRFRIVGIGASAGGLESLEQFFKHLPPNPGIISSNERKCF